MDAPREPFYRKDAPDPVADVRDAMNRFGDFEPRSSDYANETNYFEVLAVLEALTIEDQVLA